MTNPGFHKASSDGDTYIASTAANTSFGSSSAIFVDADTEFVSLVKFDLSAIPTNATITSAKVFLTGGVGGGTNGDTVQLHRLLRDWTESDGTWNNYDGTNPWGTAGAKNTTSDYNSTLLGTLTWTSSNDTINASVTASVVEDWTNGTNPNYGFRLSPVTNNTNSFHSKESTTIAFRPYMEIHYTYPLMTYELQSNAINAGIQAHWRPLQVGLNSNNTPKYSTNWRLHTWSSDFMEMADYLVLDGLKGTAFTSLKTTGESAPNTPTTYTTGNVLGVRGVQRGRRMENVSVNFKVKVS